jgi:hypothetical protein
VVPELLVLSGGVAMPPFVEEVRPVSHEISAVTSPLSQELGFDKIGVVVDADAPLSPEFDKHVVPFGGEVAKSGSDVVAREVCDFLATLVAAYPGSELD